MQTAPSFAASALRRRQESRALPSSWQPGVPRSPPSSDSFHFPPRWGRAVASLARFAHSAEQPRGDLTRDLAGSEGVKEGKEWGGEAGRGGGGGRVQRRHRRQLCERVQCVRERVSKKSVRRRVPGRRVPREGQVWAPEAAPSATPSLPAPVAPSPFPPSRVLRGLPAPVGSYLSPPPLATHLPFLCSHLGPLNLGRPAALQLFLPGAGEGGMRGAELWGWREPGPGRLHNS